MRKFSRGRRASTAVEFAIVLPALLMFILGVMDCGRLLWTYTTLARAVEAAARCAAINATPCGTAATTAAYAVTQAWGVPISASAFTLTTPSCGAQVNGTLVFQFFIPWYYAAAPFGAGNSITLRSVACYPA